MEDFVIIEKSPRSLNTIVSIFVGGSQKIMAKSINSPFRYAGGKFYARKLILEYIPPHSSYLEPFAGGASIFFAKEKVANNWLNDIDKDVINVYIFIRDYPQKLIDGLRDEVATKERHSFYKNIYQPTNDLERAVRWYYLNRTSYSGIMNMKNCYWGYGDKYSMRPENWGKNILRTSEKLQGVKITSLDFEKILNQVNHNSFLFIDPPYFNADQDKFYSHAFSEEDHHRLSEVLQQNEHKYQFLLTYDDCPEIREIYSWTKSIQNKEWNYTINRTDDQKITQAIKNNNSENLTSPKGHRYRGKEIFITNYLPTSISETTKQLALF
jgi:DNA adenine methylase